MQKLATRKPEIAMVQQNFEWIVEIAEAAAKGTQARMEYEVIHGLYNVLPNKTLSRVVHDNLSQIEGFTYTEEEQAFAQQIVKSFTYASNVPLNTVQNVEPFKVVERGNSGSTDVGDVSWTVPTAGLNTATWVPGTSSHSWQAVAAGGTSIGKKGMILAAKALALTMVDIFNNPEILIAAKKELVERRGEEFEYSSLLGDREPPLDYRK